MKKILIASFISVIMVGFTFSQAPDDKEFEPTYYENAKVIRIKYSEGETFVIRSYEEGMEEATINLPVFEKDRVGTTIGRLELYLGRLNYLRLDNSTEVEFDRVPQLRKTNMSLRINHGSVYLDIENLDREKDIEIQTKDCGVFVLDRGIYRIDVNDNGKTEISVYSGMAEICGENNCRTVQENQRISMADGQILKRPFYFYHSENDSFALWNSKRNGIVGYARNSSSRYLNEGYEDYEYELTRNGRWRYHATYGSYIWIPYNVDSYWRPYYRGRWVWNPFYGYVWSSYDTWGWFTHHYGRWHWDYYYGWYWIPAYRWSPAWVYWFWDSSYYGWCPLSYWNRPFIVINNRWNRHYNWRRGFPHHSRSTIIIRKKDLNAPHIHKKAVRNSTLPKFSNSTLISKGSAPKLKPTYTGVNVVNKSNKPVIYKSSGVVNVRGTPSKSKFGGIKSKNSKVSNKSRFSSSPPIKKRGLPSKYKSPSGRKSSGYIKSPIKKTAPRSSKTTPRVGSQSTKKKKSKTDSQMSWNPVYDDSEVYEPKTNFSSKSSSTPKRYKSSGYTYKTTGYKKRNYSSSSRKYYPKYKSYGSKSYSSSGKKYKSSKKSRSYSSSSSSGKSYSYSSKSSSSSRSRSYSSNRSSSSRSSSSRRSSSTRRKK